MIASFNPFCGKANKLLLIVLLGLSGVLSYGQSSANIDSLLNVLKTEPEDTNRVLTLIAMSIRNKEMMKNEESKKYAEETLTLSEKLSFKRGMANGYANRGAALFNLGNKLEALKDFQSSLRIFGELENKKGMAMCYRLIGAVYNYQNNHQEGLKNFLASIQFYKEIDDDGGIGNCYNQIGAMYKEHGDFSEALENFKSALIYNEEAGDRKATAMAYHNIGIIFSNQGNYPEAIKNFLAALKIKEEIGDKSGLASTYNSIGSVYKSQGNFAEAEKNLQDALTIWGETGNKVGIAMAHSNLGVVCFVKGEFDESLKQHLAALKIQEEIKDKNGMAFSYSNIGLINAHQLDYEGALKYFAAALQLSEVIGNKLIMADCFIYIGDAHTGLNHFAEAKENLMKGLSLYEDIGTKHGIKSAYESLSKLDSAMGNDSMALEHYKLYMVYKDSLLNETNHQQIAQMKEQYESEKKDKEILVLTSDKQKLESDQQISALLLKSKQDSLSLTRAENEKVQALNLYNQQQIVLLDNEKDLQQCALDQNQATLTIQKIEGDAKQQQLAVLNKENAIQDLQLKKQKQTQYYFIGAISALALLSVFVYRHYRVRQQLHLQRLRNKIASDLHDDIGSTLSSISIFSQVARQQSDETNPMLESIDKSARQMLEAMADIVWTINPENDQFEKIILRMRNFAFDLLGTKKIDFEFKADPDVNKIDFPMEVRKNLYLIFKEATNNMAKYAEADRALISLKTEKDNLTMLIRDNGKGFDPNKPSAGNGIKNMKKRAKEIGANLLIDSVPGSGTTIQLKIAV